MAKPRVVYWFRTDLRLHDSPALKAALDLDPQVLYPIWTWDPHYVYRARVGVNRFRFLLDCQEDLSASIRKVNKKSKLFVVREAPQTLFPKLLRAWKITHLVFEKDTDAYARERDEVVIEIAKGLGVEVIVETGRTLYDPDRLVEENHGKPTMSISQVEAAGAKIGAIPRPIPAPKSLPDPGETPLDFEKATPDAEPDINRGRRVSDNKSYDALAGPNGDFGVPTLEELGMEAATSPIRGGETRGLAILDRLKKETHYMATFEKPRTAPTSFEPQSTTLLSPHMHFGSVSCRHFYWAAQDIATSYGSKASQPPTSLTGQLLFRDMYFGAQAKLGYSFAQTLGNPQVRFIPWHLPSVVDPDSKLITGRYTVDNEKAEEWFQRWKWGLTGFPWIDAAMRQLRTEGWIHHLARHAVACFLTRGGCYVDWERGAEVFEEWLVDHEVACNAGNWQWLACVAFYSQFYRCYSPIAFPQKTDKEGEFVRHYVPELKDFPRKYIYEPWKAPIKDQRDAGVAIVGDGKDVDGRWSENGPADQDGRSVYPKPMFDFPERREICIQAMKKAYGVGLHGNDEKVVRGTWRRDFDEGAEGPTEGVEGLPGTAMEEEEGVRGEGRSDDGPKGSPRATRGQKRGRADGGAGSPTKPSPQKRVGTLDAHVKRTKR